MNTRNLPDNDCAVCLQKCNYPTQLPCGHIFCFLCVKGVAIQNKRCAMCRSDIPLDYLDHPIVLASVSSERQATPEEHQWYYEGTNGWWKYDERSNIELENAFNSEERKCKLLLAGALYSVDFQRMVQMQIRDPMKRRRVKRDLATLPAKGVAGIKMDYSTELQRKNDSADSTTSNVNDRGDTSEDESTDSTRNDNVDADSLPGNDFDSILRRIRSMNLGSSNTDTASSRNNNDLQE